MFFLGQEIPRRRWTWSSPCQYGRWASTKSVSNPKYNPSVNLGDVSLSAEDRPPPTKSQPRTNTRVVALPEQPPVERVDFPPSHPADTHEEHEDLRHEEKSLQEDQIEKAKESWLGGGQALKFLLAGGVAGASELMLPLWV